jgi:transposase
MRANEMERALGEIPNILSNYIRSGKIAAEKVPDKNVPVGYHWNVTTPLEEVRAILSSRRRHRKPTEEPTPRKSLRSSKAAQKPLPVSKDLFLAEEAANAAGVSKSTVYNFIKEKNIIPLRNGRNQYVPRAVVEQLRERYAKPEPVVVAPKAQPTSDVELRRLQTMIMELTNAWSRTDIFVRKFAKSCGFVEE